MVALLLKRASLSRPSGQWNDEDFDVLGDGEVVGRIFPSTKAQDGDPLDVLIIHDPRPIRDSFFGANRLVF